MNRWLKKMPLMLLICSLAFSTSSCRMLDACNRIMKEFSDVAFEPDPGPYTPFNLLSWEKEGIDRPYIAWSHQWSEDYRFISSDIAVDEKGHSYWLEKKMNLYALDENGEPKWNIDSYKNPLLVASDGIVTKKVMPGKMQFIGFDGELIFDFQRSANDAAFAPNGFLICYTYNGLYSVDANGKLMWHTYIEEEGYNLFLLKDMFFDREANGYYLFDALRSGKKLTQKDGFDSYLVSLSPEGDIRWSKVLSKYETMLSSFVPNNDSLVKDTFLLAFSNALMDEDLDGIYTARDSLSKHIVAYNTLGEELWEIEEYRSGSFDKGYAIGSDGRFYVVFDGKDLDKDDYFSIPMGWLTCLSNDGEKLWSVAMEGSIGTSPVLDNENHIYLGVHKDLNNLYAFYPDGTEKWRLGDNYFYSFQEPIVLGPHRSLYIASKYMSVIFCVKEKP